jgi:hypothetical protein
VQSNGGTLLIGKLGTASPTTNPSSRYSLKPIGLSISLANDGLDFYSILCKLVDLYKEVESLDSQRAIQWAALVNAPSDCRDDEPSPVVKHDDEPSPGKRRHSKIFLSPSERANHRMVMERYGYTYDAAWAAAKRGYVMARHVKNDP